MSEQNRTKLFNFLVKNFSFFIFHITKIKIVRQWLTFRLKKHFEKHQLDMNWNAAIFLCWNGYWGMLLLNLPIYIQASLAIITYILPLISSTEPRIMYNRFFVTCGHHHLIYFEYRAEVKALLEVENFKTQICLNIFHLYFSLLYSIILVTFHHLMYVCGCCFLYNYIINNNNHNNFFSYIGEHFSRKFSNLSLSYFNIH